MNGKGIEFNRETGRFETDWGWMKFDFQTGSVEVWGPCVNEWLDTDRAVSVAGDFAPYCHGQLEMALALAIHYQYAAWKGARQLCAVGA